MVPKPSIWTLRSETNRIIKAHRLHFLALSIIFLLPLSSFCLLYPTLFFQLLNLFLPNISHIHSQQHQPINPTPLFLYLLYSLFLLVLSSCAVISITYSIFHGFYGQPLNLLSSIKSIFTSFFPLLATTIVSQVIFFFISLLFGLLLLFLITTISYSSPYLLGFSAALVVLPFLFVVIYLQVTWTLVPVIVVVESCWGLEPLRKSASLMKGMKGVAVSLLFFFGFFEGMLVWLSPVLNLLMMGSYGIPITFDWVNILLLILGKSQLLMIFLLLNTAANTVLYIFCKGIHGEHAEECGKEYVSLPFDDRKVPLSAIHV